MHTRSKWWSFIIIAVAFGLGAIPKHAMNKRSPAVYRVPPPPPNK